MSLIAVLNRLITIVILLHSITIQTANGQDCGNGILHTRLCFDVPDNDPCSRLNNCRARAEFKPLFNNAEGIEITLSGNLRNTSTSVQWVQLHVSLEMNDERYFSLFCDTTQKEFTMIEVGTDTHASIKTIGISTTPFDIECIFEVTPDKSVASRTSHSFDPTHQHYLRLSYGVKDGTIVTQEGTRSSDTKYIFQTNSWSAEAMFGAAIALGLICGLIAAFVRGASKRVVSFVCSKLGRVNGNC